ncbi:MAG: PAS domain-containing protein, partial [Epsilonproteobacteria bacterium]|nr:PAS domain-containing protein [Campylobacterota bacterium]
PRRLLVSKTDSKGRILYSNEYFREICGYEESELYGMPHNMVRHPDMPRAIFYLMWRSIKQNKNISAVVKNLAKDGRYYWVITDFEFSVDMLSGRKTYIGFRQAAPASVIKGIAPLYASLTNIERKHGVEASLAHLQGFLEEKRMSYDEYISSLKPTGLFATIFDKMKRAFSA